MKLTINGEEQDIAAETLAALLSALDYEGDWLATAVNGELVPSSERDEHMLADGDRIEVLSPMQGG
jgi:sulfur carrier protein